MSIDRELADRFEKLQDDLEKAIAIMRKHNALADTIERAAHYGAMARDALAIFPDGKHKAALQEAVDFCIARVS